MILHLNELQLWHLFCYLNDETSRSQAFFGAIGKALKTCKKFPIITFKLIKPVQLYVLLNHDC